MHMFEHPITVESRTVLEPYLSSFEYKSSGLTFTSLYMWRNINQFSYQILGDYLCLAGISHLELDKKEAFMFPPLTKTGIFEPSSLRKTILEAKRIFEQRGQTFHIRLLPFHMVDYIKAAFPSGLRCCDDRPNYDYVYLKDDLVDLAGRKYHPKKNHLNYFHEHYSYRYVPFTSDMADDAMAFIRAFNARKELPEYERGLLEMEEMAMEDVFHNIERVGYRTGAILIDNQIQAITLGGQLGRNTITVHVEKANTEFRGCYQAINNEYCKHMPSYIRYVNREEDMGIPGLRKAKLSYHPVKLIENQIVGFVDNL